MAAGPAAEKPARVRAPGARFGSKVPVPFPFCVKKRLKPSIFDNRTISSRKCHVIGRIHGKIEPERVAHVSREHAIGVRTDRMPVSFG